MQDLRYLFWRSGWVKQHSVQGMKERLNGLAEWSDIKHGNVKRKEGDVVIIGMKWLLGSISIEEHLKHSLGDIQITTSGIYTNIYYSKKFFEEIIKEITK